MADEAPNTNTPPAERTAESIQAEFYRKTEKLAQENADLNKKLDQALNLMAQQQQPRQQSTSSLADISEDQLEELSYKDPKAYARAVEARAEKKASALIEQRLSQQNQSQMVMGQLVGDYPELNDQSSDLSKRAVEIYNQLPAHIKSDPIAYRTAVRDAAAELGVLTKGKRVKQDDGSFALGGQSSGQRAPTPKKDEVDSRTMEMAERLGLNIKDPKVVDRLKQRSQRKNWGRYE